VPKRRPNFNQAARALLRDVARSTTEFAHIKPSRVLVVAGEARRASRATVKPLAFQGAKTSDKLGHRKPVVRIRGKRVLYCVTLRPLFFRASTPDARIGTLLHELYHVSATFDGTLDRTRRHARSGRRFNRTLRPIVQRYLKRCPPEVYAAFAYDGEVRVWQWLERPPAFYVSGRTKQRTRYTEDQLFLGTVRMLTKRTRPARSPRAKIRLH
jgi:predicted metallopeptidase